MLFGDPVNFSQDPNTTSQKSGYDPVPNLSLHQPQHYKIVQKATDFKKH
jgi:hypothetical protein